MFRYRTHVAIGSPDFAQRTADNLRNDLKVAPPCGNGTGRLGPARGKRAPTPAPDELRRQLSALYQAMKRGEPCPTLELGVIGPEEAARIRRCTGQETLLHKRVLRLRDLNHANERHGREVMKGQGDLREEDFLRYAEIVLSPDWIEKGRKPGSIHYMRRYPDGTVYAVEQGKSG